ncbi:phosphatidylinositol phosphatase PTPRQ-like [Haemaphysalis longicornis]
MVRIGYEARLRVATNSSDFVNCTTLSDCELVVLYGWNSSFKSGFVEISGLKPYENHIIDLRGCNEHGCGHSSRVHVTTGLLEPSEPLELNLDTEDNVEALLSWKAPLEPGGPITGYLVSWKCGNGSTMAATSTECSLVVNGLPTDPQECSFSVSAFHVGNDGEELRGKPATLTTLYPPALAATAAYSSP